MNLKNRVQLIGNLGSDPKVKEFESGKKMARFSVATSNVKKINGKFVKDTQWHNVSAWDKNAIIAENNLLKGTEVVIQGRCINSVYKNNDGETRKFSEIIAESIIYRNIKQVVTKEAEQQAQKRA